MPGANTQRQVVPPRGGLLHVVDAARYSAAGLHRLLQETAARLELLAAGVAAMAFLWRGVSAWHWAGLAVLCALVLAIEALNTAIEVLTDRASPEWSEVARNAKDLGSLAVGLMLAATAGYVVIVLLKGG